MFLGGIGGPGSSQELGNNRDQQILEELRQIKEDTRGGKIRTGDPNFPIDAASQGEGGILPARDMGAPQKGAEFFGPGPNADLKKEAANAQIKTAKDQARTNELLEKVRDKINHIRGTEASAPKINEEAGDTDVAERFLK